MNNPPHRSSSSSSSSSSSRVAPPAIVAILVAVAAVAAAASASQMTSRRFLVLPPRLGTSRHEVVAAMMASAGGSMTAHSYSSSWRRRTSPAGMRTRSPSSSSSSYHRAASIGMTRYATTSSRRPQDDVPSGSSSSSSSSLPSSRPSLTSLDDEESAAYAELSALSARLRELDDIYYGGGDDGTSDDEYDALARREAELCVAHPRSLAALEDETGLGTSATRFGGRVGRSYGAVEDDDDDAGGVAKDESRGGSSSTTTTTTTESNERGRVKRRHLPNAPMRSLDNAMDDVGAVAWLNRVRRLLLQSSYDDDYEGENATTARNVTRTMRILAEPKIDGLGLSLRYHLGGDAAESSSGGDSDDDVDVYHFVWGATRGDGARGEDVTEAVRSAWMRTDDDTATSVPRTLAIPRSTCSPPNALEIRGEVVLPRRAFDEFIWGSDSDADADANAETRTAAFSNARNAASGILLRSREPAPDSADAMRTKFLRSRLHFYAYDVITSSSSSPDQEEAANSLSSSWPSMVLGKSGLEMRDVLTRLGFRVPSPIAMESLDITLDVELDVADVPNLLNYHRDLMAARDGGDDDARSSDADDREREVGDATRPDFPYQIDGVVYKLSSFDDRRICGSSSRAPRWAIAHKFPSASAVTQLLDIEVQVGRTGALTPVAILKPVSLSGVLVSRASLHNFHFARKLLLPKRSAASDLVGEGCVNSAPLEEAAYNNRSIMGVKKGISLLISRAGDVIPQVKKRVFDEDLDDGIESAKHPDEIISLKHPLVCPACGSPTSFDFIDVPKKVRKAKNKTQDDGGPCRIIGIDEEEINDPEGGQVLRCSGPQLLCQPRAVNGLAYAYSRSGLDVKGLSKARIGHLMEEGIIRFPSDLFALFGGSKGGDSSQRDGRFERLAKQIFEYYVAVSNFFISLEVSSRIVDLPGWGLLSCRNLAESVRSVASTGVPLSRFIYALGIPQIGSHASELMASKYCNVDSFLNAVEEASLYDIDETNIDEVGAEKPLPPFAALAGLDGSEKVKGIGPTAIAALIAFSREKVLVKAAKDLASVLTVHDDETSDATSVRSDEGTRKKSTFEGMTVVFTGAIPGMSRVTAQNAVKDLGAKATPNAISKSTTLVVEGEVGTSKKARNARELGIRVIDHTEFKSLIDAS